MLLIDGDHRVVAVLDDRFEPLAGDLELLLEELPFGDLDQRRDDPLPLGAGRLQRRCDQPPPAAGATLTARFDQWYRARSLEEVMQGMSTLYDRGYRVTAHDRAELDRVMK